MPSMPLLDRVNRRLSVFHGPLGILLTVGKPFFPLGSTTQREREKMS